MQKSSDIIVGLYIIFVDPADQYELEEEIMTALYNYHDPETNRRVIALAVRNKDAYVFGMGGPECGDKNIVHPSSKKCKNRPT